MSKLIRPSLELLFDDDNYKDFELLIEDGKDNFTMKVHKCVLSLTSEYFRKIFNDDVNIKHHKIEVNDVQICISVIASLYGIKNKDINLKSSWYEICETLLCRDYLGLPIRKEDLYKLTVPQEGFINLINVISLLDLWDNSKIIRMVRFNIPPNYGSDDILNSGVMLMIDLLPEYMSHFPLHKPRYIGFNCTYGNNSYICVVDVDTKKESYLNYPFGEDDNGNVFDICSCFAFSNDGRFLAFVVYCSENNYVQLIVEHDLMTHDYKIISTFNHVNIKCIRYMNDDKCIMYITNRNIKIMNIQSGEIEKSVNAKCFTENSTFNITDTIITPDGSSLIFIDKKMLYCCIWCFTKHKTTAIRMKGWTSETHIYKTKYITIDDSSSVITSYSDDNSSNSIIRNINRKLHISGFVVSKNISFVCGVMNDKDNKLMILKGKNFDEITEIKFTGIVRWMRLSKDESLCIIITTEKKIYVYDMTTYKLIYNEKFDCIDNGPLYVDISF
jgi:BTB/POZ domain